MPLQTNLFGATPEQISGFSPEQTYFAFGSEFGRGTRQRDYFKNQFQPIYNQFQGEIQRNIMSGEPLNQQQSFLNFLGAFPFTERFASLPPSVRGGQRSRFAPQASFRF